MVTDDINNGSGVQIIINGVPQGGSGGLTQAQVNALIAAGARYDGAQLSVPRLDNPDSQGFGSGVLTGVNQITEFTLTGSPNGGTFKLSLMDNAVAWNADEATIQAEYDASADPGNVIVTGGLDGGPGPVRLEFSGVLGAQAISLSLDTNSLTVDGDPGGDVSFNEIQAGSAGVLAPSDWTIDSDGSIEVGTDSGAFGLTDVTGLVERLRGGVAVTNTLIFHAGCSSTFTLVPSTLIPLTEGNLYRAWASVASAGDGNSLVFGDSGISDYETVTLPNTGMGGRALVSILFTAGNDYANAGVRLLNTSDVHIFYLAIEEIVTQTAQNGLHAVAGAHTLALSEDGATYDGAALGASLAGITDTPDANTVYAGHATAGATAPTFRALVAADIPTTLQATVLPGLTLQSTTSPITLNASVGTSGQVLTSAGAGATPTWTTPATSLPPSGSAGGVLDGTYPNPTLATLAQNVIFTDNTYDIGASGATRPRTLYLGTSLVTPLLMLDTDNTLQRLAAHSVQWGAANSASPLGYTMTFGESARSAVDTNTAGGSAVIRSGLGTGTGTVANITFATPTVAASGTTAQAYATRLTIDSAAATFVPVIRVPDGSASIPSYAFGSATNTGFYLGTSTELAYTAGGNQRLSFPSGSILIANSQVLAWSSAATTLGQTADTYVQRLAAASLLLGKAANATPVANTITIGESSRGGTDTDIGGGSATIQSGLGTGAGTVSNIVFKTPTVAASGTTAQAYATRLTIDSAAATFTGKGVFGAGVNANGNISTDSNTAQLKMGVSNDAILQRTSAQTFQLGDSNNDTPKNYTLTIGEYSRSGTDSDKAGASGTLQSGLGTGIGAVTSLALRTSLVAASGTTAQTYQTILSLSTAGAVVQPTIATPAGGAVGACLLFGTTAAFGIYYGSGAPTVAAAQGSFYLRSDGDATHRAYISTDGSGTWTPLVSVG